MKIIVVAQNKGGEGKSTLARLLAEWFARAGKRVLAIDMDPQCSLSQRFIKMDYDETSPDGAMPPLHPDYNPGDPDYADWDGRSNIADIFKAKPVFTYPTYIKNLDMLPANGAELREVELVTVKEVKEKVLDRVHEFLSLPDVQELYDAVVIDTAPSKGPLSLGAIRASSHMLIPCQMETQSVEGLRGMIKLVREENRLRTLDNELRLIGIVANKFRQVTAQQTARRDIEENEVLSRYLLPFSIGLRTAFSESDFADAQPRSIFDLPESNPARTEAETVCRYVERVVFEDDAVAASAVPLHGGAVQ